MKGPRTSALGDALGAVLVGIILSTLVIGSSMNPHVATAGSDRRLQLDRIKREMHPLDLSRPYHPTDAIAHYFAYYGLAFEGAHHWFGTFDAGDQTLAAHLFIPEMPRGTCFLLHGYLDHSGTFKNVIAACLQENFAVAIYDLPGHGLSTGERAAIGDFSEYVTTFQDFIAIGADHLPPPFHLIGHSMGCAIAYEYMVHTNPIPFEEIVFLAPLVRNAGWRWSVWGYRLAKPFVDSLPRMHRNTSSDPAFLAFIQQDPLQGQRLPIRFLDALYAWNRRIQEYESLAKPVLIVQGTDDAIVDWEYNIGFLKKNIRGTRVVLIQKGKHQLANEHLSLRQRIFQTIFSYVAARTT